jgi:hypothetical protein
VVLVVFMLFDRQTNHGVFSQMVLLLPGNFSVQLQKKK